MGVRYISLSWLGNRLAVTREIILKDNSPVVQCLVLPPEVFSLRAGEYGLDPIDDADAIWDIVLNEPHLDSDTLSPLLTEETLEGARDLHLKRCRAERDKLEGRKRSTPWVKEESKNHQDVLDALRTHCPADKEFALLHRDKTKHIIKHLKANQAPPTTAQERMTNTKLKLRDDIIVREGFDPRKVKMDALTSRRLDYPTPVPQDR